MSLPRGNDPNYPVYVDSVSGGAAQASESTLAEIRDRIGDDVASPAANTLQDRLKTIAGHLDTVEALLTDVDANTDLIEGLLTTIRDNADTVETKLQTLIDQTDTAEALLADIDANTDLLESLLTDLSKAEDAAHGSGDKGIMMLAVRKDTAAALAGTDGDYAPFEVDAVGRAHVRSVPDRPSMGTGRTHKEGAAAGLTASSIVGATVTGGKTLYVTSMVITGFNNSAVTTGLFRIEDGSGGTLKIPFTVPANAASNLFKVMVFPEPLQFSTSVFFTVTAGTAAFGISWVGYEE